MTPFGAKVRVLRKARGVALKELAASLKLSSAYLSALEHGHRGLPSPALVVQICEYFGLIWDDYDDMQRLAALSHPRIAIDTAGLSPAATALANRLAARIASLDEAKIGEIVALLDAAQAAPPRRRIKPRRRAPATRPK